MKAPNVVIGQRVTEAKADLARELRRHMTPEERILWGKLRGNRLFGLHFRRQQIIDGFIVDFYCHEVGLVVEVDGAQHDDQVDYDTERDRVLAVRGLGVLRISNGAVRANVAEVLTRIADTARLRLRPATADGLGEMQLG